MFIYCEKDCIEVFIYQSWKGQLFCPTTGQLFYLALRVYCALMLIVQILRQSNYLQPIN